MAEVAPGVFRLAPEIVNWYVVKDGDALTAVGAGLSGFGDHTGLAPRFRRQARVLIHSDDARTLAKPGPKSGDAAPLRMLPHVWRPALWRFLGCMARRGGGKPPGVEVDATFADAGQRRGGRLRSPRSPCAARRRQAGRGS